MIDKIKDLYDIDVLMIQNISQKVYKIKSLGDSCYILKYVDDRSIDGIISKINTLGIEEFDCIILNRFGSYISSIDGYSFYLSPYYEETTVLDELKLKMYVDVLSKLHNKSFYTINVNDDFFLETYDYIEERLVSKSEQLDKIIGSIEKDDYKSPFGWMLTLNYSYLRKCMDKSYEYLEKFKRKGKDKDSVRMVFSYLNFNFNHIMLKDNKIISIEKMKNAPPIFDIVDMVEQCYNLPISLVSIIEQYVSKFNLNEYEKYWLLSILYIPSFNFDKTDDIEKMKALIDCLEYCKCIEMLDKNMQNKN